MGYVVSETDLEKYRRLSPSYDSKDDENDKENQADGDGSGGFVDTRKESYESIKDSLSRRQREVYLALSEIEPANNRMIAERLGLPINSVTGRVFELREKGFVFEFDQAMDDESGKLTSFWKTKGVKFNE